MGCFGYICKGCGTPINGDCATGGEKCVLIHIRHGNEIGRVEGHYNEYGCVIGQEGLPEAERYRAKAGGPNSHSEIGDSEYLLDDSYYRLGDMRVYKDKEVSYYQYVVAVKLELRAVHGYDKGDRIWGTKEASGVLERRYAKLPVPTRETYSGTVAWHSLCYHQASPEARNNFTPSDSDPIQSWGRIRKKYK